MRTQINLANVKVFSGIEPDGDEYRRCRVTFLGNSAALWRFWEGKWLQVDRLADAILVDQGGLLNITGVSRTLVTEVGLAPDNARVRWEIKEIGCSTCH